MTQTFVPLDNKNCLNCAYLVTDAKVFRDECPSLGTALCPAGQFKIGLGVNIDKASTSIALALYEKDAENLARLFNKLSKFPKSETTKVLDLVFDKTAAHYGIIVGSDEDEAEGNAVPETALADADSEDTDLQPQAAPAVTTAVATDADDEDGDLVPSTSLEASKASSGPVGQVQRAPVAPLVAVAVGVVAGAELAPVATSVPATEVLTVESGSAEGQAESTEGGEAADGDDEWSDGGGN